MEAPYLWAAFFRVSRYHQLQRPVQLFKEDVKTKLMFWEYKDAWLWDAQGSKTNSHGLARYMTIIDKRPGKIHHGLDLHEPPSHDMLCRTQALGHKVIEEFMACQCSSLFKFQACVC